jgi:DMSO/TMAO reductase YedYZ heme-binding membrane subunit
VKFTLADILIPGVAPWKTTAVAFGTIAFWLLIPVSFMGRIRAKLGQVGNRWFLRTHYIAYAAWPIATAHYVLAGTDALTEWSLAILFAGTALVVMGLLARGFVPDPGPTRPVAERTHVSA